MRYAYYPGCYAKGTAAELDLATRAVCGALDIELVEMTAAPCCGAGDVQQIDGPLGLALNELTLAQAEQLDLDILTICNICTLSLRQAAAFSRTRGEVADAARCVAVADPARDEARPVTEAGQSAVRPGIGHLWPVGPVTAAQTAQEALAAEGLRYGGGVHVTHLLWVLWRDYGAADLAAHIARPLSGVRLAPFYGCQILRPGDLNDDDVSDDPSALEDVIAACGAQPVDHPARLRCCGWPLMHVRQGTATAMASAAVRSAAEAGADAMITPCPLCHAALEGCQMRGGGAPRLPVLHLPQAVGLAVGLPPADLGLGAHLIDTRPLLARLGLVLR